MCIYVYEIRIFEINSFEKMSKYMNNMHMVKTDSTNI